MNAWKLGIDIGALFVKIACVNGEKTPITRYRAHQGNPVGILKSLLEDLPEAEFHVGATGSGAELVASSLGVAPVHFIEAEIQAALERFPGARNILNVGGGSCTIIHLDENGRFLNYSGNSLCAAGTGSFLDEQSRRLGLTYEDMARFEFHDEPPAIASRCAVFAKSDLIHRQQEGYSKAAMWAGLCKGCVDTFLQTLLKGKPLTGQTVVTGGVVQNKQILERLARYFGDQIVTWDQAHLAGAFGAAGLANGQGISRGRLLGLTGSETAEDFKSIKRGAMLTLHKTKYPSFAVLEEYVDEGKNEVRIGRALSGTIPVTLGIDIGSTSTKCVLLDPAGGVALDIYRKTQGDPVGAVKKLFIAIGDVMEKKGVRFEVTGCGTTGSGRKFVGKIVGADSIINEISAHVAGAMATDPTIDTIFEIGGQDSKYMRTVNGAIRDANMNFICAAGTGSFVEEQAVKLGFPVGEIGDAVMGVAPPETSDRCTVFMEEDTHKLLRQGFSKTDAIAAVMNSVVKNYLNKVVGNRHVSKSKVFFQGATARNKGLVAAFENLLGVEVVVSPLCHQMGSYGVALLTAEQMKQRGGASGFRGFDLHKRNIEIAKERCDACNNHCEISFARIEGVDERPSWGYLCGREPGESKRKANHHFSLFRKRDRLLRKRYKTQETPDFAPVVTLPSSLATFSYLPFWTAFFNALGRRLVLTEGTNETIKERGTRNAPGDFCFPIKVAIGHALTAMEQPGQEFVLIPQVISAEPSDHCTNSLYCPYVQSHAGVTRSILKLKGMDGQKLLTPVLDFRWDRGRMEKEFERSVGGAMKVPSRAIRKALNAAFAAQYEFVDGLAEEGRKALAELAAKGEKAIVILGRPYNCFDGGANLDLPEKISEYGYTVVPIDFLPFEPRSLGEAFRNIYWSYGQKIMAAVQQVAANDRLFAVYLSNFNCGPDSFLLTYAEQVMGDKPLLILELDEHGADAGYLTRVEAFLDVVSKSGKSAPGRTIVPHSISVDELKQRTLWLPPMHPHVGELVAGIFQRFGYKAEALPPEDREAFEIGRAAVRGSECLPTSVTIGGLLKKLREIQAVGREHVFFMATATGPCRFGQYARLHRMILDRHGYEDLAIMSPSSYNSYQGLEEKIRRELWSGFLAADAIFKMQCKIRPYEATPGETDFVAREAVARIRRAFAEKGDLERAVKESVAAFSAIKRNEGRKPLVGIVGEIYVRCNPFSNGYVIDHIERYGGEAWLAPLSEWILYTTYLQEWSAKQELRNLTARGKSLLKNMFVYGTEHKFQEWCRPLLADRAEPSMESVMADGQRYLPINFEGEAIITLGRAIQFIRQGAGLVVNCAPFGCMPGTLTSSIFQEIEQEMGVPVVSMYYDGEGEINRRLEVYLHQLGAGSRGA